MKPVLSIASLALLAAATGAAAQAPAPAAAPVNFNLPRAYTGYSQPEITQCTTTGDLKRACVVPAMTAGRYLIVARDSATSTGAGATQTLAIDLNGQSCATLKSGVFTGKKGVPPVVCQVTLLTDEPLTIAADYSVENATPEPGGPRLVIRRVPWNGIVDARGGELAPRPAPAAPAAPAKN